MPSTRGQSAGALAILQPDSRLDCTPDVRAAHGQTNSPGAKVVRSTLSAV